MRKCLLVVVLLTVLLSNRLAYASDDHSHFLLSVGAMDARIFHSGEPTVHLGPYGIFDVKYVHHISESWMIIPAIGFDWAPGGNQWGVSGSFTFEYKLHERVRIDLSVLFMHDQDGHAELFVGGGPGLTFKVTERILVELLFPLLACLKTEGGMLFAPSVSLAWRF